MLKQNTYRNLITVLKYVIEHEHNNFCDFIKEPRDCAGCPSTLCENEVCPEDIEDAFADNEIQHVYKSAKLAYWDLLDNRMKNVRYGLVDLDCEKQLEADVIQAEIFLCEKKLALLQHKKAAL